MRSMTGFGAAEHPLGPAGGKIGVEVRAVNHRFLDVRVRVPRELGDLAMFVEQLARAQLTRGRLEINVRIDGNALPLASFDRNRAKAAYLELCALRDEVAPKSDVPFSMLNAFPELFVVAADGEAVAVRKAAEQAFSRAVAALDTMRG